jgi:hypothetical protein
VIESPKKTNIWLWVSLLLAVGWLITVIVFLTKRKVTEPVIEINDSDIKLKDCIKNLKNACRANDAAATKNALLEWGRQKFNVANLGAIAEYSDARLRDEILDLNQTLYGKGVGQWQGKKLFQAFTENKAREKIAVTEDNSLEPLYRL